MKKLFFVMLALVVLASCSKDEVVQLNQDEIRYSVVANKATKAKNVYCNNNLMDAFNVWAYAKDGDAYKNYISGDAVTKQTDGSWKTTNTRFWPNEEVSFFAHVNAGSCFTWPTGTLSAESVPTITDFTVDSDVAKQVDLLYAVAKETKAADNTTVEMNFRHALSQIVFYAKNEHPNIHVDIESVKIFNVNGKNTFTYPNASTATNWSEHDNTVDTWAKEGSWATVATPELASYQVKVSDTYISVPYNTANAVNLTDNATNHATDGTFSKSMLLLPQTTAAYANTDATTKQGSYIILYCKIYNVSNGTVDRTNDVVLESTGVAMPIAFAWEQGKKYVYTFIFGADTNGGYEIDGDKPTDEEVLVNINYSVTVDDFLEGGSYNAKLD